MNLEENKKVVIRFDKEFIENGNVEILNALVSKDFANHCNLTNPKFTIFQLGQAWF